MFSKNFRYALKVIFVIFLFFSIHSCKTKDECSVHDDCKEGHYCSEGSCEEIPGEKYKISFPGYESENYITAADDADDEKTGVQVNIPVRLEAENELPSDGLAVVLKVSAGDDSASYEGSIVEDTVWFRKITLSSDTENTISAELVKKPSVSAEMTVEVLPVSVDVYYHKGAKASGKTPLKGATVTDEDDAKPSETGLNITLEAETEGIATGEEVFLYVDSFDSEAVGTAAVDAEGDVSFGDVEIPVQHTVTMRVVSKYDSGSAERTYEDIITFKVDSSRQCSFSVNIPNNGKFGIADDEDDSTEKMLEYTLEVDEIEKCGGDSKIRVFVNGTPDEDSPDFIFTASGGSGSGQIQIPESDSADDVSSVTVQVLDETENLSGVVTRSGILVDLQAPAASVSFPDSGQILTMDDDADEEKEGLQFDFAGTVSDNIAPGVDVKVSISDSVVAEADDISGDFSIPYSFTQSNSSVTAVFSFTDSVGNMEEVTVPFSVELEDPVFFESICTRGSEDIFDNMWLNAGDDTDSEISGVQCSVVVGTVEGINATEVSLKIGDNPPEEKPIGSGDSTVFEISIPDTSKGVLMTAETAGTGSQTGRSASVTLLVDTVLPRVSINNNKGISENGVSNESDVEFIFTADDLTGCDFKYRLNDGDYSDYSDVNVADYTSLSDGEHTFYVIARDEAGNESLETTFSWTIDTVVPETVITEKPQEKTNSDSAYFSFEADKKDVTFECKLLKDGANYLPSDDSWEDCSIGSKNYNNLEDGSYSFSVRAEDGAGNLESEPAEYSWMIGTSEPQTTIDSVVPGDKPTNSQTITFEYSSVEDATFECSLEKDGSVLVSWEDCSGGSHTYDSLEDGQYVFFVKATDAFGNMESSPEKYGWTVDTEPPLVKITSKPSKISPYSNVSFSFSCEGETLPCTFSCKLDDGEEEVCTSPKNYDSLGDGEHTFTVIATDAAGNESEVVSDDVDPNQNSYTWEINQTVIGVEITSTPDDPTSETDAEFEFSSNRPSVEFQCRLDALPWKSCSSPESYSGLDESSHTFEVKATDTVNGDEASASHSWTVDATDPVITITSGPDSLTNETSATFQFSADETVEKFECKLDSDVDWSDCSSPHSYSTGSFGEDGEVVEYTFRVKALDPAGNTGETSHTWTVDLDPPVISYVSPEANGDGDIIVGRSHDKYLGIETQYAVDVEITVSGANPGSHLNVSGSYDPPGYDPVEITTENSRTYTLEIGLEQGAYVDNSLTFSVSDDAGNSTVLNKNIIVNTEEMMITWNTPGDGTEFLAGGSSPSFRFNVWNVAPGVTVELMDNNTGLSVASVETEGTIGDWEVVNLSPELDDSCTPYEFYARVYDDIEEYYRYTDSTKEFENREVRSFTVNQTKPEITVFEHLSDENEDGVLFSGEDESSETSGMQAGFSLDVTGADGETLYIESTRNLSFEDGTTPVSAEVISGSVLFDGMTNQFITLEEGTHTLTASVEDCAGNEAEPLDLGAFLVDTEGPEILENSISPSEAVLNASSGTVDGEFLTSVDMTVPFGEDLTGEYLEITHEIYDYDDILQSSSTLAPKEVSGSSVEFALPDMDYNKHKFIFNITDEHGNPADEKSKTYEVDPIVPSADITYPEHDPATYEDQDPGTGGFHTYLEASLGDVEPESTVKVTATPIDAINGTATGESQTLCERLVTVSGSFRCPETGYFSLNSGFWRFDVSATDDHNNTGNSASHDVEVVTAAPSNDIYKNISGSRGDKINNNSWFKADEGSLSGGYFLADIEVVTDAEDGTLVDLSINSGTSDEWTQTGVSVSGGSALFTDVQLLPSGAENEIKSTVYGTENSSVTLTGVKADETVPEAIFLSPSDETQPQLYTGGGKNEVGYVYSDDANSGTADILEFKSGKSIRVEIVADANGGDVTVESDITDGLGGDTSETITQQLKLDISSVSGDFQRGETAEGLTSAATGTVDFVTSDLLYLKDVSGDFTASETVQGVTSSASATVDSVNDTYLAVFNGLTLKDSESGGQTSHNLTFTVTEEGSENTTFMNLTAHVFLENPEVTSLSISTEALRGGVTAQWTTVSGNSSNPVTSGAVYDYDIRYQHYNSSCSIDSNFENAVVPLTDIVGEKDSPLTSGQAMDYFFHVKRLAGCDKGYCSNSSYGSKMSCEDNGETWTWYSSQTECEDNSGTWTEADIHDNGDTYCFAIRAVDAVYAEDGTVLGENYGSVEGGAVEDSGEIKLDSTVVHPEDSVYDGSPIHLKNVGDLNGDGVEDYAVGIYAKDGWDGYAVVYSGTDNSVLYEFGGDGTFGGEGMGISDKADFDGDGIPDFAYYDYYGTVHVIYGKDDGTGGYELDVGNKITLDVTTVPADSGDGPESDGFGAVYGDMATMDLNGDGYTDIAVSVRYWKHDGNSNAGAVFVYFGNSGKSYDATTPDMEVYGPSANYQLGFNLKKLGKFKGGIAESLAVGNSDNNTVWVVYGDASPSWSNREEFSNSGYMAANQRISYGEFNDDGYDDLVISNRSRVRFYYGSDSGLLSDNIWLDESFIASGAFGLESRFAVSLSPTVEDFSGDGKDGLITASDDGALLFYSGKNFQDSYELSEAVDYRHPYMYHPIWTNTYTPSVLMMPYGVVLCDTETARCKTIK